MQSTDSVPPTRELVIPQLAVALVVLAVPALLWNRALLPALPGTKSGIEQLFDSLSLVGSVLSQLLALGLSLLLLKLTIASLGAFAHGAAGRLLALPIGSAVTFLLIASTVGPLDAEMHLLLSGLGSLALLSCLGPALRQTRLRASGLLLLLTAVGSLAYSIGRLLALKASFEALPREYAFARILTNCGQFFDFLSLLWVTLWLVLSRDKTRDDASQETADYPAHEHAATLARVAIAIALGVTCSLLALRGQISTANFAEVVLGRCVAALSREPRPFGTAFLGPTLDLIAVGYALLLLTRPKHVESTCRHAMALVLLGRCAPDIPSHCALMTGGAMLLLWYAPSPVVASPMVPSESLEETEDASHGTEAQS